MKWNKPETDTTHTGTSLYRRLFGFLRDIDMRNLWIALSLLLTGLTITAFTSLYLRANIEAAAHLEFDFICNEVQINIANRLAAGAQLLRSGVGLFGSSENVTGAEWGSFAAGIQSDQHLPGIQGFGFSLLIPPEQLEQHIQEIRGEGFPEYTVRPEGERDIYSSIIYLEPFSERNLRAFGYDMFSEPVRRAAMEQARDENSAVLSGKVILVQETDKDVQAGTLMYLPVYRRGMPIATIEERRAAIVGWVYSPYRMTDMINGTLQGWDAQLSDRQIYLEIYDGDLISQTPCCTTAGAAQRMVWIPRSGLRRWSPWILPDTAGRCASPSLAGWHPLPITALSGSLCWGGQASVCLCSLWRSPCSEPMSMPGGWRRC